MPQENPADAIVAHHAEMLSDLQARVDDVVRGTAAGKPAKQQADAVLEYIRSTIIPHAAAEERVIYRAADRREHRLIESLTFEHKVLRGLAARLSDATTGPQRVAAASAFVELFSVHAAKENDFVIPTILEDPSLDLVSILHDMHSAFEDRETSMTGEIDVRRVPHAQRHDAVFARLEKLEVGEAVLVVNDHDPKPLCQQIQDRWPATFACTPQETGPEQWKVAVARR